MYSQFNTNCSEVDLSKVNLIFCGTGAICSVISAVIVALILLCGAYCSILERLFLYLMVAILLRELFIAASFEHYFEYEPELQEKVCTAIGFIWNWTGILVFVFTVGMKVYLLFYVRCLTRGDTHPVFVQSRRGRVILESLYVILSVILTVCYALVPYFTKNYGLAGAWCWIRAIETDDNCTLNHLGMLNQIFSGYVFYVSGSFIGLVLLIAIVVLYCRLPEMHSNEARMLLKKTFYVILTFVANIIMMVFALLTRLIAAKEQMYKNPGIWYSFGVTFPISMLLFPLIYMKCFFRLNQLTSCCYSCCPLKRNGDNSIQNPTIRESSTRVSAPSMTYFEVLHSNDFSDNESEPLTTYANEEYGSVKL